VRQVDQDLDALFDDGNTPPSPVKFVAESGKFEPGKLAPPLIESTAQLSRCDDQRRAV
jgi:hypothetical protein